MIQIRRSEDRGHAQHGWLDSRHTFAFADYQDARFMGFRSLRVINEDWVAPGQGFGTHGHRDMEIVTLMLEGALAHRDSLGNGEVLRPGEVQRMTAGTGVRHSEFNASPSDGLHLLQIWILPDRDGLTPGYEQKLFPDAERQNRLRLVASPDAAEGSLTLHQDARVYLSNLDAGATCEHPLAPGRGAWVQVVRGAITLNGEPLRAGDGAAVEDLDRLVLRGIDPAELLVFDLG